MAGHFGITNVPPEGIPSEEKMIQQNSTRTCQAEIDVGGSKPFQSIHCDWDSVPKGNKTCNQQTKAPASFFLSLRVHDANAKFPHRNHILGLNRVQRFADSNKQTIQGFAKNTPCQALSLELLHIFNKKDQTLIPRRTIKCSHLPKKHVGSFDKNPTA